MTQTKIVPDVRHRVLVVERRAQSEGGGRAYFCGECVAVIPAAAVFRAVRGFVKCTQCGAYNEAPNGIRGSTDEALLPSSKWSIVRDDG